LLLLPPAVGGRTDFVGGRKPGRKPALYGVCAAAH